MVVFEAALAGVFGVRGVSCDPATNTRCRGVIGTFFESASRCLGVLGVFTRSAFPSSKTGIEDFATAKWELILEGETVTRCSEAPCLDGTVRTRLFERVDFVDKIGSWGVSRRDGLS